MAILSRCMDRVIDKSPKQSRETIYFSWQNGFDINVRQDVDNLPTTIEQKVAITEWIVSNNDKKATWGRWQTTEKMPDELRNSIRASPLGCVEK